MIPTSIKSRGYEVVGAPAGTTTTASKRRRQIASVAAVVLAGGAVCMAAVSSSSSFASRNKTAEQMLSEEVSTGISSDFDTDGRFILKSFDSRKPFSSFLPGIGGEWGMPMWAFYVNRGQGIAAFGVENKDGPLMEFTPANKAYQTTTASGFRTLLKVDRGKGVIDAQPFFNSADENVERTMLIGMNELEIIESDSVTELSTRVLYFTVPGEDFPALVRRVTFKNTGDDPVDLEILDGIARLEPFGVNSGMLAAMGRTLEGWMRVYNCVDELKDEGVQGCYKPYFKLSASTADSAQVQMITEGNFAVSFVEGSDAELLPIVVDPASIFGADTTLTVPELFESVEDTVKKVNELKASKTPCAFAATKQTVLPGASVTVVSVYGHAKTVDQVNEDIAPSVLEVGFVASKYTEAVELAERLTSVVQSSTSNALFDAFSRQMMLDNLLRGGFPEFLGSKSSPKVYHTFSRIHGDLERDYNNFQIDASYYSQGSGNYRDVNQNRRVDVLLFPELKDFNLRQFLTLKQADGYNPLTVTTAFFMLNGDGPAADALAEALTTSDSSADILSSLLQRPFRPGQLFKDALDKGVNFTLSPSKVLDTVAAASTQVFSANYTHEGFWADHWTYDLDQIESFEAIYPDEVEHAMWDAPPIPFYMSSGTVQPRDFKYVEVVIGGETVVRQYNSVYDDPEKLGQLSDRITKPDGSFELALTAKGRKSLEKDGTVEQVDTYVYMVSPISKLLLLFVTKFALLDPSGMGIEMDANKPGWNDAMNGLPGLLGSGMAETCETLRVAQWLIKTLTAIPRSITVPAELDTLMLAIENSLDDESLSDFEYWDSVAEAREAYRLSVRLFFSGLEKTLEPEELVPLLKKMADKLKAGIEKSLAYTDGIIMPSYFSHEVVEYDYTGYVSFVKQPFVHAKKFKVNDFPMFLEGPVRQLKTIDRDDKDAFVALYEAVLKSSMYDEPIGQYKICESLEGQPFEMGRMMAFTPGWLENESIWLHMSFKYYLELLRAGLYEQFWLAMETGGPYNMDVDVYGRSPLECSSFIVSSAYPDESMWGSGFLARLSGSTAEFLSMWTHLLAGQKPFGLSPGNLLELTLNPAVPAFLFKEDDTVSFTFLGDVQVTYHNPSRIDTWKAKPVKIDLTNKSGETISVRGAVVPSPYAAGVRDGEFTEIDVLYP